MVFQAATAKRRRDGKDLGDKDKVPAWRRVGNRSVELLLPPVQNSLQTLRAPGGSAWPLGSAEVEGK